MLIMNNDCGHGNCKNTNCNNCVYYSPKMFGIKVPKSIANIGYKIENKIIIKYMFEEFLDYWELNEDEYWQQLDDLIDDYMEML